MSLSVTSGFSDAEENARLERFGYEPAMERPTGRFASFAVAFAFVSIATGTFTTYGSVLNTSGPVGIWTWPITVVGSLAVALIYGSLAARIPVTGYSYQWMSRLANPLLGWGIGWLSFTFLAVVVGRGRLHDRLRGRAQPGPLHRDRDERVDHHRGGAARAGVAGGVLDAVV